MNSLKLSKFFVIFIIAFIALILFNVSIIIEKLADITRIGKMLFFLWLVVPLTIFFLIILVQSKNFHTDISVFALILVFYVFINGKNCGIWNDEKFLYLSGCLVVVLSVSHLVAFQKKHRLNTIPIILLSIILTGLYEALYGLLQLYDVKSSFHANFKVTGTFFNPAPYSGYLVAVFPFALQQVISAPQKSLMCVLNMNHRLYKIRKSKQDGDSHNGNLPSLKVWLKGTYMYILTFLNRKTGQCALYAISLLTVFLIIIVLPATLSRASWLGILAASVFLAWQMQTFQKWKARLFARYPKWIIYVILICLLTAGLAGIYLLKKDSASGRLLIWKITLAESLEKPVTGHGFNAFMAKYPPAQAKYFSEGKGTQYEGYVAGNVRYSFNEPLQLFFEQGIVGLLLFLFILGWAMCIKKSQKLEIGTFRSAKASILGVFVFSLFSYPFYSVPICVVFAVSLGILSGYKKPFRFANLPAVKYFIIAVVFLIVIHIVSVLPRLKKSYWLWDEANALYAMNSFEEANKSFREAYNLYLDQNGIFLLNYAKSLYLSEKYEKALEMLKEGKKHYTDEVHFTTLGDTHKALGNYQKAEKAYLTAANMVPHKFYPLYLLAKLYDQTGNKKEVLQTVNQVMNKKVKVHSPAIEQIKEEMRQLKNKYQ